MTELSPLREGRLTASRVACLMNGSEREIMDLWRELVGDPSYAPDDLSGVWPVQLGLCTERLNVDWYERRIGRPVTRRQEFVQHPGHEWACCTLDGWDGALPGPVEAKHVGQWVGEVDVRKRYAAQLHWQMIVTESRRSVLSVIFGASAPELLEVPYDETYGAELWRRAEAFIGCVWAMTPPVDLPAVAAPPPPERWRSFDLDRPDPNGPPLPNWAPAMIGLCVDWKETAEAAGANAKAAKEIKALLPDDVGLVSAAGIVVKRARNGAVSIKGATAA